MTINAVEQILDGAIALLMYGSGAWLAYAFTGFVVTRSHELPTGGADADIQNADASKREEAPLAKPLQGRIADSVQPAALVPLLIDLPAVGPSVVDPFVIDAPTAQPIVCQPVNWKKWKVGDLRKANIARICGVRVSPIGSSRKLTKADLIAQYEQNLKRMTCEPPLAMQESIA